MARGNEHLVGRVAELGTIDGALDALDRREPVPLLLLGEPGIGKSRLLAELGARGETRGYIVLSGSASELESDLPFWPFVEALDEYVAGLEPRRIESLDDDVRAELAQLFPSLSHLAGAPSGGLHERYRAHRAVGELLERLAATKPLLLVLDDLHWADPASVDLLAALLRLPPSGSVQLAMAARPKQLPARLASALERAHRTGGLTRIELGPLRRDEAAQLLGDGLDAGLADAFYEETGGNPFYLEQLARTVDQGDGREAQAAPLTLDGVDVPPAVVAALGEELALLPAAPRRLLEGASVAGDPFDPELAGSAAEVEQGAAREALDELLAAQLIRETDVPRRFRFRHPLVRRVVYDAAPGGWRLGAHERCSEALAQRGASAVARAHHVEHSARQGDAASVALLREAGQTSTVRAPASAARWFGAALRLLPDSADPGERIGLLMARAQTLGATGRLEEGRKDLLESIALIPAELVEVRVRLTVACAGVEHVLGRHEDAHARLTAALEELPAPDTPEAVALQLVLAFDAVFRGDYAGMREIAGRALEAARPLGDPGLTAMTAAVLTLGSAFAGTTAEAGVTREAAAGLIDAMSDEQLAGRIDAAAHLAMAELYLDRYDEATAHAERALTVARATGQHFPTLVPNLATAYVLRGRLPEAVDLIERGVEAARLAENPQDIGWALHIRASAALAAGDVETALRLGEEAVEVTRGLAESFVSAFTGLNLAAALVPAGETERAVEALTGSGGGQELPLIPGGWRAMGLALLTTAYLDLGRREEAQRAAALAQARADQVGLRSAACWASRAAAEVALDAGDPKRAAEHALASAAAAEEVGLVTEGALSRVLAGRALAQAGDEETAATELERAAAVFEECGAPRYRDAAERELRRMGRRIHRRTAKGTAGEGLEELSERELQVARLVVDRKTNREIAAELFVSLKTVEAHMRNLFRKLGVGSRVEVARVVERAERLRVRD